MDPVTGLIDPSTGRQSMLGDPLRAPSTLIGTLRTSGVWDGLRMATSSQEGRMGPSR